MSDNINGAGGVMGTLRNHIDWHTIVGEIKGSRHLVISMLWMLSIGFAVGYLIKKYSKYLVVIVLFLGIVMILQHFNVVSIVIHKKVIYELFSIPLSLLNQPFSTVVLDIAIANKAITLSGLVGFLLGVRIG